MSESVQIIIRPYQPQTDDPLIYSTWTKSCYYADKSQVIDKRDWFTQKIKEIRSHLENHTVCVACFQDDPNSILGYAVFEGHRLVWMYVKKNYRDQGIERLLTHKEDTHGKREDAPAPDQQTPPSSD